MKLTEQEIEMFKSLQQTQTGVILASYLERFLDQFCDVRTMIKISEADIQARASISKMIESELISKLKLSNKQTEQVSSDYV